MSMNAPKYGWGTGGRHKAAIGTAPRPACGEFYEATESIGPQTNSTKRNAGAFAFARGTRFDSANRSSVAAQNPGPGAYKIGNALGPQPSSALKSTPVYGFTRDTRFRPRTAAEGGRSYLARSAVGPQVISDLRSKPSYGFGSARRFPDRPATSSGPGPGSYNA